MNTINLFFPFPFAFLLFIYIKTCTCTKETPTSSIKSIVPEPDRTTPYRKLSHRGLKMLIVIR